MSTVLSIRIDKKLKELMKKIPIDWRSEIKEFIRRKVHDYLLQKFIEEARKCRASLPKLNVSAAELIREDRDER